MRLAHAAEVGRGAQPSGSQAAETEEEKAMWLEVLGQETGHAFCEPVDSDSGEDDGAFAEDRASALMARASETRAALSFCTDRDAPYK